MRKKVFELKVELYVPDDVKEVINLYDSCGGVKKEYCRNVRHCNECVFSNEFSRGIKNQIRKQLLEEGRNVIQSITIVSDGIDTLYIAVDGIHIGRIISSSFEITTKELEKLLRDCGVNAKEFCNKFLPLGNSTGKIINGNILKFD